MKPAGIEVPATTTAVAPGFTTRITELNVSEMMILPDLSTKTPPGRSSCASMAFTLSR